MPLSRLDKCRLVLLFVALGLSFAGAVLAGGDERDLFQETAISLSRFLSIMSPLLSFFLLLDRNPLFVTLAVAVIAGALTIYANYWEVSGVLLSLLCVPIPFEFNAPAIKSRWSSIGPSFLVIVGAILIQSADLGTAFRGSTMYVIGVSIVAVVALISTHVLTCVITLFAAVIGFSNIVYAAVYTSTIVTSSLDAIVLIGAVLVCSGLGFIIIWLSTLLCSTTTEPISHLRGRIIGILMCLVASLAIIGVLAAFSWSHIDLTMRINGNPLVFAFSKRLVLCALSFAGFIPLLCCISLVRPSKAVVARTIALALFISNEAVLFDYLYLILISMGPLAPAASHTLFLIIAHICATVFAVLLTILPVHAFVRPPATVKNMVPIVAIVGIFASALCGMLSGVNFELGCGNLLTIQFVGCMLLLGCVGIDSITFRHLALFSVITIIVSNLEMFFAASLLYDMVSDTRPSLFELWLWGSTGFLLCGALSMFLHNRQVGTQSEIYSPLAGA